MRRALLCLLLAVLTLITSAPNPSADTAAIDGTTMVDFSRPANFKVGSWVHYRSVSSSLLGAREDYDLWLLIAGEVEFWGERCFWLETWTKDHDRDTVYTAALITYAVFGDTAALRQPTWFQRETVGRTSGNGTPEVDVSLRDRNELRVAAADRGQRAPEERGTLERGFDTLAVDTCRLPLGSFRGPVAREISRFVQEVMPGDSTVHYERLVTRLRKLDDRVPITRTVREDILDTQTNDVWPIGESKKSTRRILEEARGIMLLEGYGDHGLMPRLVTRITPAASARPLRIVTPAGSAPATPATPKSAKSGQKG